MGKPKLPLKLTTLAVCMVLIARSAFATTTDDANTQYIYYDGTLTGNFAVPDTAPSNCSNFDLTQIKNATMKVGVNPPWDKNPIYWQISNYGAQASAEPGEICFGSCTRDSIFNFYFESTEYQCFKDNQKCGVIVFSPYYYVPLPIVDVNAATIKSLNINGSDGYSVVGDPGKFVSNGTVEYSFDFQAPRNYSANCLTWSNSDSIQFTWNDTTPFSYALNFTNTTISASLTLSAPAGTVSMIFSGHRQDDSETQTNGNDAQDNGQYTPISLDTSNPNKPQFTFVNGSQIKFIEYAGNEYRASAVGKNSAVNVVLNMKLFALGFVSLWQFLF